MKTSLSLLVVALLGSVSLLSAQSVWQYDFGTNTGSWTSGITTNTFAPQPASGGGSNVVRVGTQGGSLELSNVTGFGTNSALTATAATNTSINKFSIFGYDPGQAFTLSFDIRTSGASSGTWFLFTGAGNSFYTANGFAGNQTFTGLAMGFGASGTMSLSNRASNVWSAVTLSNGASFAQDSIYTFSIFGNNSALSLDYVVAGVTNSLASNTYDLWINDGSTNILAAQGLAKAQMVTGTNINSFMFYGQGSAGNDATIELNNFTYANHLIPEPSTYALLALSALGFAAYTSRRRRKQR